MKGLLPYLLAMVDLALDEKRLTAKNKASFAIKNYYTDHFRQEALVSAMDIDMRKDEEELIDKVLSLWNWQDRLGSDAAINLWFELCNKNKGLQEGYIVRFHKQLFVSYFRKVIEKPHCDIKRYFRKADVQGFMNAFGFNFEQAFEWLDSRTNSIEDRLGMTGGFNGHGKTTDSRDFRWFFKDCVKSLIKDNLGIFKAKIKDYNKDMAIIRRSLKKPTKAEIKNKELLMQMQNGRLDDTRKANKTKQEIGLLMFQG